MNLVAPQIYSDSRWRVLLISSCTMEEFLLQSFSILEKLCIWKHIKYYNLILFRYTFKIVFYGTYNIIILDNT